MGKITRRLVRETAAVERGRPLIVELHPGFVVFRLKRTRYRYSADWHTLYRFAQKAEAERIVAERKRSKQSRRQRRP
jgi:hypothetical protein